MKIEFTRLRSNAPIPSYAKDMDAGMDLRADNTAVIAPFTRALINTGIKIALPRSFAGFILSRSGLAFNYGVIVANAPGLIDAGYRGEIKVLLLNTHPTEKFTVNLGDRIAQLVIQKIESVSLQEVVELDTTERGEGGFGHTGMS